MASITTSASPLHLLLSKPVKHFLLGQSAIEPDMTDSQDGYDELNNPDDHPTPDNMWNFSDSECSLSCGLYTGFAGFLLFTHLAIMAGPLRGWA